CPTITGSNPPSAFNWSCQSPYFAVGLFLDESSQDLVFRNYDELREVDGKHAFAKNGALPASLALATQKGVRVLKVIAVHNSRQSLRRRQRAAVTGIDITELAFRNHHERLLVDAVLPRKETRMQTAAQQLCLKSG